MDYVFYDAIDLLDGPVFGSTNYLTTQQIYEYEGIDLVVEPCYNGPSSCSTSLAFWLGIEACTPEDFEYTPVVPKGWDQVEA